MLVITCLSFVTVAERPAESFDSSQQLSLQWFYQLAEPRFPGTYQDLAPSSQRL